MNTDCGVINLKLRQGLVSRWRLQKNCIGAIDRCFGNDTYIYICSDLCVYIYIYLYIYIYIYIYKRLANARHNVIGSSRLEMMVYGSRDA